MSTYTAKISSNGQISVPAPVRRRWAVSRVVVIDKGDRMIVRPVPNNPIDAVIGRYAGGTPSDEMRRLAREEDAADEGTP